MVRYHDLASRTLECSEKLRRLEMIEWLPLIVLKHLVSAHCHVIATMIVIVVMTSY